MQRACSGNKCLKSRYTKDTAWNRKSLPSSEKVGNRKTKVNSDISGGNQTLKQPLKKLRLQLTLTIKEDD